MINKLIKTGIGTWVSLTEYPDETLCLEGIQVDPDDPRAFSKIGIRFSPEAIAKMLPHLQEWIDSQPELPF